MKKAFTNRVFCNPFTKRANMEALTDVGRHKVNPRTIIIQFQLNKTTNTTTTMMREENSTVLKFLSPNSLQPMLELPSKVLE